MTEAMIPTTPYLIRAIYEWCEDQGFTPHLLVDTSIDGVVVPWNLVENDTLVLNVQASAVRGLELGNEWIMFNARFSGKPMDVALPVAAVRAIFARENGQGYAFETPPELSDEESKQAMEELNEQMQADQQSSKKTGKPEKKSSGKSFLKLVE